MKLLLWDQDRNAAEVAAKILNSSPEVCETFEQVSDDVDLVAITDAADAAIKAGAAQSFEIVQPVPK